MQIKIAQPPDWQEYKEIRLESLKESPQAFGGTFANESSQTDDQWKERITDNRRFFVLAQEGGATIGITGAKKVGDTDWTIVAVYLTPESRGKGYSKQLLSSVLQELKSRGAKLVTLTVNTEQKSAIKLYQGLGFQITDTLKDEKLGDGLLHDEYVMEMNM
jgi:ribosomal protein S18 acetylase RimI-like enzyme